jgi:hypothetical protein
MNLRRRVNFSDVGLLSMKMEQLMRVGLKFALAIGLFVAADSAIMTPLHAQSIEGPAVMRAVAPIFPLPDKGNIAVGTVVVEVRLDDLGVVTWAKAVQGHPALYPVCERAAKRWLFAAGPNSDARIVRVTFVFRIMDTPTPQEDLGPIFSLPYKVEIRSIGRLVRTRDT